MRRIFICCLSSLLLYGAAFGLVLNRPLSLGFLRARIDAKLARGAAVTGPKLVILAGSNGPYSHRCATIAPILGRPCVNAGVAVGIGLDYLFARWKALLHPGDWVYLPLEEAQYVRPRAAIRLGPDAVIMLRHDRATLLQLAPDRWMGAVFSGDLRGALMSLIESALVAGGFHDPRERLNGSINAWGDHVGHTRALAAANRAALAAAVPYHPTGEQVRDGGGTAQVTAFLHWAAAHRVQAIGGLPTGFADSPIPPDAIAAIRQVYAAAGAWFLALPNRSRYPRSDFFDTPDHLNEPAQIAHSRLVAQALRRMTAAIADNGVAPRAVRDDRWYASLSGGALSASRAGDPSGPVP